MDKHKELGARISIGMREIANENAARGDEAVTRRGFLPKSLPNLLPRPLSMQEPPLGQDFSSLDEQFIQSQLFSTPLPRFPQRLLPSQAIPPVPSMFLGEPVSQFQLLPILLPRSHPVQTIGAGVHFSRRDDKASPQGEEEQYC